MGCDIHLHTEIKLDGVWHHYSSPCVPRSYALFTAMAGVRNTENIEPISEPKGLPGDLSEVTRRSLQSWEGGRHSDSWLSAAEINELDLRWAQFVHDNGLNLLEYDLEHRFVGYLDRNAWSEFVREGARPLGVEDIRWVFWFDN